jgi:S-DNA-T family DNA segregation ATPase FtsK/SpoIIIE
VTTKTEQSAGGADAGVATDSAGAADASPLPSIIVDAKALPPTDRVAEAAATEIATAEASAPPAAAAPGTSTGETTAHDHAAQGADPETASTLEAASTEGHASAEVDGHGGAAPESPRGNGAAAAPLTDFEAERFATTFRASWEPGEALDAPMPAPAVSSVPPGPGGTVASEHPVAVEPLVLAGSARSRGVMLTAVAVVAFVALVALALFRTSEPALPSGAEPKPAAHTGARPPAIDDAPAAAEPAPPAVVAAVDPPPAAAAPAAAGAIAEPLATAGATAAAPSEPAAPAAPAAALAGTEPTPAPTPTVMPAAQAAPEPAPRIETVRIRLTTSPKDATLSIDGITVPNPYDQLLPKGGKHRVTASAPDHETREQMVDFERRRDLVLRLPRVRAPRPAAEPRPIPAPVAKAPPPPRPAAPKPAVRAPKKASPAEGPAKGAAFVSESPY